MRLGEALGLQHRDWCTGRGDTPLIEIVPRSERDEARAKSGHRRIYISDEVDRLYGEYVWQLCELGADLAGDDFDAAYVFVNLGREPRFAPWEPESVYDLVDRLCRQLAGHVPDGRSPHWLRHSHATALLLSGVPVHVVNLGGAGSRRQPSEQHPEGCAVRLSASRGLGNEHARWIAVTSGSETYRRCSLPRQLSTLPGFAGAGDPARTGWCAGTAWPTTPSAELGFLDRQEAIAYEVGCGEATLASEWACSRFACG